MNFSISIEFGAIANVVKHYPMVSSHVRVNKCPESDVAAAVVFVAKKRKTTNTVGGLYFKLTMNPDAKKSHDLRPILRN